MNYLFDKPVPVVLGTMSHLVGSIQEASEILEEWPTLGGRCQQVAKLALRAAMDAKREQQAHQEGARSVCHSRR